MADPPESLQPAPLPQPPESSIPAPRPVFFPPRPHSSVGRPTLRPPRPEAQSAGNGAESSAQGSVTHADVFAPQIAARPSSPPPPPARPPANSDAARWRAELESERAAAEQLKRLIAERHALMQKLEKRLRAEAELRARLVEEHAADASAWRARVADLEGQLASAQEPTARLAELRARAEEVPSLRARVLELEGELRAASELLNARSPSEPEPGRAAGDDLTRIRGIGPAFERLLRAQKVTHWQQLAACSDAELSLLAKALRVNLERILREDWRAQAAALSAARSLSVGSQAKLEAVT